MHLHEEVKDYFAVSRNLTFWSDDFSGSAIANRVAGDVSRCWCDPSAFSDVVGVDFGKGEMHLYSVRSGLAWKVPAASAMSEILGLSQGTLVVGERAHLATKRTAKSLAQPFTESQLSSLYRDAKAAGITIKLFPHHHTGTRARAWVAARSAGAHSSEKTDENDAKSIAIYVSTCNAISLADPPQSFGVDLRREYGKAVREYSLIALNAERTDEYKGRFFPNVVALGHEIERKHGKRLGRPACISIASMIATEVNGSPSMFVRGLRPPGVEFWWRYVARMTPFHHRGGIARSNLMRHSFRPFLRRFGRQHGVKMSAGVKIITFGDHDDRQQATRTAAMKAYRDMAKACYRHGVNMCAERGFGTLDPTETRWSAVVHGERLYCNQEATNGR